MSETLIPFDFAEFAKEPMRVRTRGGTKPVRAAVADGDCVFVQWDGVVIGTGYIPVEFHGLRLAAKMRTIRMRMYRDSHDNFGVAHDYYVPGWVDRPATSGDGDWLGEPFEREIPA